MPPRRAPGKAEAKKRVDKADIAEHVQSNVMQPAEEDDVYAEPVSY